MPRVLPDLSPAEIVDRNKMALKHVGERCESGGDQSQSDAQIHQPRKTAAQVLEERAKAAWRQAEKLYLGRSNRSKPLVRSLTI